MLAEDIPQKPTLKSFAYSQVGHHSDHQTRLYELKYTAIGGVLTVCGPCPGGGHTRIRLQF